MSSHLPPKSQSKDLVKWEVGRVTFVCVCASMLSISLSCVHSQLWLVPIPSIPSITLTTISTPAASLLQPAAISTTQAAHGPLAHPCPFQTGPIPQVRDEDQAQILNAFQSWQVEMGKDLPYTEIVSVTCLSYISVMDSNLFSVKSTVFFSLSLSTQCKVSS